MEKEISTITDHKLKGYVSSEISIPFLSEDWVDWSLTLLMFEFNMFSVSSSNFGSTLSECINFIAGGNISQTNKGK